MDSWKFFTDFISRRVFEKALVVDDFNEVAAAIGTLIEAINMFFLKRRLKQ